MMTFRWSSRLVPLLLLALLVSPPAHGKVMPQFKQHVEKALQLFDQGEYEEAAKEFQAAYAIRQLPRLLLNIAQCHRKLGRAKEALGFYEFYLRVEPNPKPEIKTELESYIKQTRAMLEAAERMKAQQEAEERERQEELGIIQPVAPDKEQEARERTKKEQAEKERAAREQAEKERIARLQEENERLRRAQLAQGDPLALRKGGPAPVPVHKKWWFWTAIAGGAVIIAGAATGAVLATQPRPLMEPTGIEIRDQTF